MTRHVKLGEASFWVVLRPSRRLPERSAAVSADRGGGATRAQGWEPWAHGAPLLSPSNWLLGLVA